MSLFSISVGAKPVQTVFAVMEKTANIIKSSVRWDEDCEGETEYLK